MSRHIYFLGIGGTLMGSLAQLASLPWEFLYRKETRSSSPLSSNPRRTSW